MEQGRVKIVYSEPEGIFDAEAEAYKRYGDF
jgi:hypothetical protein